MTELLALLDGRVVGVLRHERSRLTFVYADSWRDAPGAYPLSMSMPLAAAVHPHAAVEPFLWGLMPDNDLVLTRWAQRFQVSPRNAFALLGQVGEDCAGAVQFVREERRDEFLGASVGQVDWLSEADVANRLRALQVDASAGRVPGDTGQFSLAGAQPKTALLFDGQRWGVPSGRAPTTHILKPQIGALDGHAENEHLCLALARALGLSATRSRVHQFEDVTAIVVERYDRVRSGDPGSDAMPPGYTHRVHQEDFCQALRVHPARKYQNDGGPGPKQIVDLLRASTSGARRDDEPDARSPQDEDIATFLDALILNWLIGGTDAHAKNYSILIGGGGVVRLAPLYDIASVLAYPKVDLRKATLAMKVGDKYRLRDIGFHDWRELAASVRVDPDALIERVRAMAVALPDHLADEVRTTRDARLSHPVIDNLAVALIARAHRVAK